jgi:hypothetical protein
MGNEDPKTNPLAKAMLRQLKTDFSDVDHDPTTEKKAVVVQFNPETLKVSYQNQIQQPDGAGDKTGSQSQLFVGSGTTKLTCTLWFDVNAPQPAQPDSAFNNVDDVRKLTNRVAYFMTAAKDKKDPKKFVPPAVRFEWGSFRFDGIVESIEETLELFSAEGRPLRASVGIAMSQQKILIFAPEAAAAASKRQPGTKPTTPVPEGASVQKMAGANWQDVAQANGIENPRLPSVGLRLDLQVG